MVGQKKETKSLVLEERNSPAFLETALHSKAWLIRGDTGRQKRKFILKKRNASGAARGAWWLAKMMIGRHGGVVVVEQNAFLNIQ